jgi:hypothetical protein
MNYSLTEQEVATLLEALRFHQRSLRKEISTSTSPAQRYRLYIAKGLLNDLTKVRRKIEKETKQHEPESKPLPF